MAAPAEFMLGIRLAIVIKTGLASGQQHTFHFVQQLAELSAFSHPPYLSIFLNGLAQRNMAILSSLI